MASSLFRLSLLVIFFLSLVIPAMTTPKAAALGGADFRAGRIIDDFLFYDGNNMSVTDIQNFLNSRLPNCDTNHARSSNPNDPGPPYTCLKNYQQNIPGKSADAYCPGAVSGGVKSAAQIIKDVAAACSINPKIILITLQKEQSLITDTWPWPMQYTKATGMGCPDSSLPVDVDANQNGCYDEYEGFFNQIWYGARQFQRYAKLPNSYSYKRGQSNYIQYNPNAGCGGSNVFIQNQATAGLYNYTPYQPNQAALNNLYGTGDGCSAYGNRNFWRLYNDWFGASTSNSKVDFVTFIRLNHGSGNAEAVGYSSVGSYSYISKHDFASYPAVPGNGNVVPLLRADGNLSFVRLNHSSGNVEIVTYSAQSGFKQLLGIEKASYPAVPGDGNVVPLFRADGNLSFVRLNHSSGNVEIVTYSVQSGFRKLLGIEKASYPAVPGDGAVIPLFKPSSEEISFIRLNHSSGNTEVVSYSVVSGFKQLTGVSLTAYPAVAPKSGVYPQFTR